MTQTIIKAAEVIRHSVLDGNFPASKVKGHIRRVEQITFKTKIGIDFYKVLLADLVDYSSASAWDHTATYALDVIVQDANGMVFKSLKNGNTDPLLNEASWVEADKFETECYNDLWFNGFLREYLAGVVAKPAAVHGTFPAGAHGITEKYNDQTGIRTATNPNQSKVIKEIEAANDQNYELLVAYIQEKSAAGSCDFTGVEFLGYCEETVVGQNSSRRRIFYKR